MREINFGAGRPDPHSFPSDALAEAAGTIGYEVLTSLGARYARTWTGGGGSGA